MPPEAEGGALAWGGLRIARRSRVARSARRCSFVVLLLPLLYHGLLWGDAGVAARPEEA